MSHTIERCPECRALEGVIRDDERDCPHCERGGQLEPVRVVVAEATDEMARRFLDEMEGVFVGTPDAMHKAVKRALTLALQGQQERGC